MAKKPQTNNIKLLRGRVDSVTVYEVKENELDILENGEETSLYLNISVALLSAAISCTLTFCTATFNTDISKYGFLFFTIIAYLAGLILLLLWFRGRKLIKSTIDKIKARVECEYYEELTENIISEETPLNNNNNDLILPKG